MHCNLILITTSYKARETYFYSSQTCEDNCRSGECENAELLLTGIVHSTRPV